MPKIINSLGLQICDNNLDVTNQQKNLVMTTDPSLETLPYCFEVTKMLTNNEYHQERY